MFYREKNKRSFDSTGESNVGGLECLLSPQLLCFNKTQVENASQKYLHHLHPLQLCGTARDVASRSCCHRLASSLCDTQQLLEAVR